MLMYELMIIPRLSRVITYYSFFFPGVSADDQPSQSSGRQAEAERGPGRRRSWGGRQHNNTPWHASRGRWGRVWMSTGSTDCVETQSRFPDVLWTQAEKRKEGEELGPRQPGATTSWKHFSRLTSKVSDLWRQADWPTYLQCVAHVQGRTLPLGKVGICLGPPTKRSRFTKMLIYIYLCIKNYATIVTHCTMK